MRKDPPYKEGAIKKMTGNDGIEIPGSGDAHGEQSLCRFTATIIFNNIVMLHQNALTVARKGSNISCREGGGFSDGFCNN